MQAKKSRDKQFATAKCLLIYQWYQRRHILLSACLKVPIQVAATCKERSPEFYLCMVNSKWYELYLDDNILIHHMFIKKECFISIVNQNILFEIRYKYLEYNIDDLHYS